MNRRVGIIRNSKSCQSTIRTKLLFAVTATSTLVLPIIVEGFTPNASIAGPQTEPIAFEVATIKPGRSNAGMFGGSCHGTDSRYSGFLPVTPPPLGRCRFTDVTLKMVIQEAYDIRGPNSDDMVVGGPKWIASERFTIEAKAEEPTTLANLRAMLRTLLQDRFKLKTHIETTDLPGYALVIARDGSKLRPATGDEKFGISGKGRGRLIAENASIMQLATTLAMNLSKPVVDQTGLTGTYSFSLTWTPGENAGGFSAIIARLPPEVQAQIPGADPNGPSIFTAVQEQLGLRLDSRNVPTEILVIDTAEQPTAN